jgi:hypothetical protein
MQKLFFSLIFTLVTLISFGQDVANFGTSTTIIQGKQVGKFEVKLPSRVTNEDVSNYAQYYTNYFTVTYNNKTNIASIQMVNNDSQTRRIIIRFLAANQISLVSVDNTPYDLNTFYDNFLK